MRVQGDGAGQRRIRHRPFGALTGVDADARIDELAYHWLAATQVADAAKAIDYARRAGDRALAGRCFDAYPVLTRVTL